MLIKPILGYSLKAPHPVAIPPLLGGSLIDVGDTNVQFSVLYFAENKDAMWHFFWSADGSIWLSDSYGWFLAGFQLQWNNIFGINQTPGNIFDVIFRISSNGTNCPVKIFNWKHSLKTFYIKTNTFLNLTSIPVLSRNQIGIQDSIVSWKLWITRTLCRKGPKILKWMGKYFY